MFNYQNRGISTLVAIGIIVVLVVVVGGGILGYQYFLPQKNNNQQQTPNNQTNNTQSSITVVSPNGGEAWARGSTHDITWTSTGVNKITIWAWKEGASDVAEIITGTSQISASLGKYTWTIPTNNNDINLGGNFKVSISAVENQSIKDSSDNYFSIVAPTNQTAGWKTYSNTQYGYEIKYPTAWSLSTDPALEGIIILSGKEGTVQLDNGKGLVALCEEDIKNIKVGSEQFSGCDLASEGSPEYWYMRKIFGNFDFRIYASAKHPYLSNRNIILEILSTFKFTK